jgi:glutaredoxin
MGMTLVALATGYVLEPELTEELLATATGRKAQAAEPEQTAEPIEVAVAVQEPSPKPRNPAGAAKASDEEGQDEPVAQPSPEETFEQRRARLQAEQQRHLAELRRREEEERDLARKRMVQEQIEGRALSAARRNVSITMYSTEWCGACKAARSYMDREQIAYVEHDIDRDPAARERARKLNPRGSVPTIDVDGSVMIGFSARTLESKIDASARQRARM